MIGGWYSKAYRCRSAGLAAAVLLIAVAQAQAQAPAVTAEERLDWTIAYVDGAARMGTGRGVWWSMRLGEKVPPGNHIETGANGRVTLVRGGDSIEVAPDSEFSVSHPPETGEGAEAGQDAIVQRLGKLLFRMESRESRDFIIETPFLAAAIKGTTFTVTVTGVDAVVAVDEGSVEVTARTGEVAVVEAGGTATASSNTGLEVKARASAPDKGRTRRDVPDSSGGDRSGADGQSGGGTGGTGSDGGGTGGTGSDSGGSDDSGGDGGNSQGGNSQ